MATQQVFFTNPSEITQLQQTCNILPGNINQSGKQAVTDYINTTFSQYPKTYSSSGPAGGRANTYFIAGNVLSGEFFEYYTGAANATNPILTGDNLTYWGSSTKIVGSLATMKAIEDEIITPQTKLSAFWPELTGPMTYWSNIQVTDMANFPALDSSWTGTVATSAYRWQDLTFEDCMHMHIGIYNDFFSLPCYPNWAYNSSAIKAANFAQATGQGYTICAAGYVQFAYFFKNIVNGTPKGIVCPAYPATAGGSATNLGTPGQIIANFLAMVSANRTGELPMQYDPNPGYLGRINNLLPYNISGYPATYDTGFGILGFGLDKAIKSSAKPGAGRNWTSFAEYVRDKVLTPLGITNAYTLYQETVPDAAWNTLVGQAFRRSPALGATSGFNINNSSTWISLACSTGYAIQAASYAIPTGVNAGQRVWATEVPDDGISIFYNNFLSKTGTVSNAPVFQGPVVMSYRDFAKIIRCMARKGLNDAGQRVITTESWKFIISPKVRATILMTVWPYPYQAFITQNTSFALGCGRTNRDLTDYCQYGYDDSTVYWSGVNGSYWYSDFETGNYMIYGSSESLNSSGNANIAAVAPTTWEYIGNFVASEPNTSRFLTKLTKL